MTKMVSKNTGKLGLTSRSCCRHTNIPNCMLSLATIPRCFFNPCSIGTLVVRRPPSSRPCELVRDERGVSSVRGAALNVPALDKPGLMLGAVINVTLA